MKTRTALSLALPLFAATAFAATPQVSNVSLSATGKKATITYDLSASAGIVTMEIQTNAVADLSGEWVPIDGILLTNVSGDVSCVVQPGTGHRIVWPTKEILGEGALKKARAVLTAWSTNAPPDWCVGDLTGADVPRYYTATNYFPLGFGSDVYKTSKIVFKRVRAKGKSFSMGQPTAIDANSLGGVHPVTLTRDYYLAIYETTQAQYHYATGSKSPWAHAQWPTDALYYDSKLPFLIGWWNNIRGGNFAADGYASALDTSFVGKARTKTGLLIDLPTEAEWEFAARCGGMRTKTQLVNGEDAAITNVAWVSANSDNLFHDVGMLLPNDWGFYDMIGNVAEACLDQVTLTDDKPTSLAGTEGLDPIGEAEGTATTTRGSRRCDWYGYSVTRREKFSTLAGQQGIGFRAVAVIEPHDFSVEPDVAGVTMFQNPATRTVKIGYNLTDADRIVTLSIETNTAANASGDWIALPEQATSSAYGDVNRIVKAGASSKWIYWNPDDTFADELIASGAARAIITTWATNTPPNYMVVDLTGNSVVRYYTSTNALPDGGLANPLYKTRYMVFRKIPAKDVIWTMGVVTNNGDTVSNWSADELERAKPHKVKLSYDYYIAIFELTRAQVGTLYGKKVGYGSTKDSYTYVNRLPANGCYLGDWDTAVLSKINGSDWYGGQYEFKMESSAEWEFACRAGEPKVLYSGEDFKRANVRKIGNTTWKTPSEGGTFPCNRWGLYDMLGNMIEMCRDKMTASDWLYWETDAGYVANGYVTDPEGPPGSTSGKVAERGFGVIYQEYQLDTGIGYSVLLGAVGSFEGSRLVCPIPGGD